MQQLIKKTVNLLSKIRLLSFEKVLILYMILTSFVLIFNHNFISNFDQLLLLRVCFLVIIITLAAVDGVFNKKFIIALRYIAVALSLIYWYPETFDINRIFGNLDYKIANWEQAIFGFQPALVLHNYFPQHMVSELVHFGYFAYYPIIVLVGLYILIADHKKMELYLFTLSFAFFSYYLFYVVFPTAGPQYYFPAIGLENAQAGIFPNISQYFNQNAHLIITEKSNGFFFSLVEYSQQIGERPTAAFPSSHVGISTVIVLFLAYNRHKKTLFVLMPVYLLLVFSTVYIQAHYVVDVIAGLVSAAGLVYLSRVCYPLFSKRFELNTFVFKRLKAKTVAENR